MPTTFTHDLFGREVYRMLPQEEREKSGAMDGSTGLDCMALTFYFTFICTKTE